MTAMRILYLFPRSMDGELQRVRQGEVPADRMYGLVELAQYGHEVAIADGRFKGRFGRLAKRLRGYGVNLCDPGTLLSLRHYDVVLVKDDFSTMLTLACRLFGKKIVYLDSLFDPPSRAWKDVTTRANLKMADRLIVYSRTQVEFWSKRYGIPRDRFTVLPYTIDESFYRPLPAGSHTGRPYVLSVGRDMGRRFDTLVEAMDGLGIDLKLVTLPYLLKGVDVDRPWIEVLQNVSYQRLFELYAGALMVAIPLKRDITYPSGVRGLLEGMALGKAVVSSRTTVLEEYAADGEGVLYVEPENPVKLRERILALGSDHALLEQIGRKGKELVSARYGMEVFARGLEACLQRLGETDATVRAEV
jgi:glycosyltransferase involved in cell wall biosynthesis